MQNKKYRITVTALSDMMSSFYEEAQHKNGFNPIAMPDLGYGSQGYRGTESEYYKSIAWLIERANEEGSQAFILGFGPRCLTSTWIKAAELIIQGSRVKTVLIPMCKIITGESNGNPYLDANILYVNENGIYKVDAIGKIMADTFFNRLARTALQL